MWFDEHSDLLVDYFGVLYKIQRDIAYFGISLTQKYEICKIEHTPKKSLRNFIDCFDFLCVDDFGMSIE
jgi:hypothetical protein